MVQDTQRFCKIKNVFEPLDLSICWGLTKLGGEPTIPDSSPFSPSLTWWLGETIEAATRGDDGTIAPKMVVGPMGNVGDERLGISW